MRYVIRLEALAAYEIEVTAESFEQAWEIGEARAKETRPVPFKAATVTAIGEEEDE